MPKGVAEFVLKISLGSSASAGQKSKSSSEGDEFSSIAVHRGVYCENGIVSPQAIPNSTRILILIEPANVPFKHASMCGQDKHTASIG